MEKFQQFKSILQFLWFEEHNSMKNLIKSKPLKNAALKFASYKISFLIFTPRQ